MVRVRVEVSKAFSGRFTAFYVDLPHLGQCDVKISYGYQSTLMDFISKRHADTPEEYLIQYNDQISF